MDVNDEQLSVVNARVGLITLASKTIHPFMSVTETELLLLESGIAKHTCIA